MKRNGVQSSDERRVLQWRRNRRVTNDWTAKQLSKLAKVHQMLHKIMLTYVDIFGSRWNDPPTNAEASCPTTYSTNQSSIVQIQSSIRSKKLGEASDSDISKDSEKKGKNYKQTWTGLIHSDVCSGSDFSPLPGCQRLVGECNACCLQDVPHRACKNAKRAV